MKWLSRVPGPSHRFIFQVFHLKTNTTGIIPSPCWLAVQLREPRDGNQTNSEVNSRERLFSYLIFILFYLKHSPPSELVVAFRFRPDSWTVCHNKMNKVLLSSLLLLSVDEDVLCWMCLLTLQCSFLMFNNKKQNAQQITSCEQPLVS